MIHALVLLISLVGFLCLSLSMGKHQKEWLSRDLPRLQSHLLRCAGFLLIASALPIAIIVSGVFGPVAWVGHISLAAAIVFVVLLKRRHRMKAKGIRDDRNLDDIPI